MYVMLLALVFPVTSNPMTRRQGELVEIAFLHLLPFDNQKISSAREIYYFHSMTTIVEMFML